MKSCSLLIPCYNAAPYIERTWQAIAPFANAFHEVLCLDDGSTDETYELLQKLPVRSIRSETNRGVGATRNALAQAASGEWIYFLDADDHVGAQFVQVLLQHDDERSDVVTGNVDWVDSRTGAIQVARRYSNAALQADPLGETIRNPIGVIGAVVQKDAFLNVDGFREDIACWEDSDLFVRLAAAGYHFRATEAVVAQSIRHDKGISANQLYCLQCRIMLLKEYAASYSPQILPIIAAEAEKVAWQSLQLHDPEMLSAAVRLAEKCGVTLPTSKSIVVRTMRCLLSPEQVLRFQHIFRRMKQKSAR